MSSKITQTRAGNVQFDLTTPEDIMELWVEGLSEVGVGNFFSKLVFHTTTAAASAEEVEQRMAVLRLVIPTLTLAELCRNVLGLLAGNKGVLTESISKYPEELTRMLSGITLATKQEDKPEKPKKKG